MKLVKDSIKVMLATTMIAGSFMAPAQASDNPVKSVGGVVTGVPVGFFIGGIRGSHTKSAEYADSFSAELGDGPLGNIVGIPVGGFVGAIVGGVTGMVNGVVTGVSTGWEDPFTNESYSADGDLLDYDPFEFDS